MLKANLTPNDSGFLLTHFGLQDVKLTSGIKELPNERYSGEMDIHHQYNGCGFLQKNLVLEDITNQQAEENDKKFGSKKTNYLGEFLNGEKSGFGKFQSDNYVYIGGWLNDKMHGFGYFEAKNGDTYIGSWLEGKRSGYGKEKTENYQYKGEWANDLPDGTGFHIDKLKSVRPAVFKQGQIIELIVEGLQQSKPSSKDHDSKTNGGFSSDQRIEKVKREIKRISEENFINYSKTKLKRFKNLVIRGRESLQSDFKLLEQKLAVKNSELDTRVENLLKEIDEVGINVRENYFALQTQCNLYGQRLDKLQDFDLTHKDCPFMNNRIGMISRSFESRLAIIGETKKRQGRSNQEELIDVS